MFFDVLPTGTKTVSTCPLGLSQRRRLGRQTLCIALVEGGGADVDDPRHMDQ